MSEEHFDLLDALGRPLGRTLPRRQVHREGQWHACFHCFVVFRDPSGTPIGLFQKRAATKGSFPGCWDATVTGHLSAGETIADGIREIYEEIGLKVDFRDLVPLGRRYGVNDAGDRRDFEIHHGFLLERPVGPSDLLVNEAEVEGLLALDLREGLRLMRGEMDEIRQPFWICRRICDLPGAAALCSVRRDGFVPTLDDYYGKLMRIGLAWLEGHKEWAFL